MTSYPLSRLLASPTYCVHPEERKAKNNRVRRGLNASDLGRRAAWAAVPRAESISILSPTPLRLYSNCPSCPHATAELGTGTARGNLGLVDMVFAIVLPTPSLGRLRKPCGSTGRGKPFQLPRKRRCYFVPAILCPDARKNAEGPVTPKHCPFVFFSRALQREWMHHAPPVRHRLRMATCLARYDVATGRSWRANEPGLIVPVRQTAAAAGLTAGAANPWTEPPPWM
jgi:hypothetical protein